VLLHCYRVFLHFLL